MREIFVFGSNTAGRHGKGAALFAREHHGAVYGNGSGLQGNSYAIPTRRSKREAMAKLTTLPLPEIQAHINVFLRFAREHPEMRFIVTRIGCGLAGYRESQIAPMFFGAPENCVLPNGWR